MSTARRPQKFSKEEEDRQQSIVNPFDDGVKEQEDYESHQEKKKKKKQKKEKKDKKIRKQQKAAKKRKEKQYSENSQSEEDERNSMFDQEAESGEQQYDQQQYSAQIGYEEQREKFNQLYKKPKATDELMRGFQGKNQRQINARYSKKAKMMKNQQLLSSEDRPKLFVIKCQRGEEENMVIKITNKTRHDMSEGKRSNLVSVFCLRKKPGLLFIEAYQDKYISKQLADFVFLYLNKIEEMQPAGIHIKEMIMVYTPPKINFQVNTFVKIKNGLYKDDLAKIIKINKHHIDVLIVPRLDPHYVQSKINQRVSKMKDQTQIQKKKDQILLMFAKEYKQNNYGLNKRPPRKLLTVQNLGQLNEISAIKKVKMSSQGHFILSFLPSQVQKATGTYNPIDLIPLQGSANFIEEIKQEAKNMMTATKFMLGQSVQIKEGENKNMHGKIIHINQAKNVATIKCKTKQDGDLILYQFLDNLFKRFKEGDRIKVISGTQIDKIGTIIKMNDRIATIFTDNHATINVNVKCLIAFSGQVFCSENVHNLKMNDLIRTKNNVVGIVVAASKDLIKIIDTNNNLVIVNNIDFAQKLSLNYCAQNLYGKELKNGEHIIILGGQFCGIEGVVRCVYKQQVFIFNRDRFKRTFGYYVDDAKNFNIVRLSQNEKQYSTSTKAGPTSKGYLEPKEVKVGDKIIISSGKYKSYQGTIKYITKNHYGLYIHTLSKWTATPRDPIQTNTHHEDNYSQMGKTPDRMLGSYRSFGGGGASPYDV